MTRWLRAAGLACATLALSACGGDASWCVSGEGGGWAAGYNHDDCPPEDKVGESVAFPDGARQAPSAAAAAARP